MKNKNDALDVVQETAFRSFQQIKKLKRPQHFKTWLVKIAINCSLDLLKKQRKIIALEPEMARNIFYEENENIDLELTIQDLMEYLHEEEKIVVDVERIEKLFTNEFEELPW